MATYSLCYKPSVEKDLLSIPHALASRLLDQINRLPSDPFLLNPRNFAARSGSTGFVSETIVLSTKWTVRSLKLRFTTSGIGATCIEGFVDEPFRAKERKKGDILDFPGFDVHH